MEVIALILKLGTGLILVISGVFKIMSLNTYVSSLKKYKNINKTIRNIVGFTSPFIEVILGTLLVVYSGNKYIYLFSIVLFCLFILINLDAIVKKNISKCMCFGKVIETRYGKSGIIQSSLFILSILPSIFINEQAAFLNIIDKYNTLEMYMFFSVAAVWALTMILVRTTLDKITPF